MVEHQKVRSVVVVWLQLRRRQQSQHLLSSNQINVDARFQIERQVKRGGGGDRKEEYVGNGKLN